MGKKRDYPPGVRAALILLSEGSCYWSDCPEPIVQRVEETYKVTLEIAHICALNAGGERYDPEMTDEQRNAFDNLIFLCHAHHQVIDAPGAAEKWPAELLRQWKAKRESGGIQNLRGLRYLTEDRLNEIIKGAIASREADVRNTLDRLEQSDSAAAELMRELLEELRMTRDTGAVVNLDAVEMLYHAAGQLSQLRGGAEILLQAAHDLTTLGRDASVLQDSVDQLGQLSAAAEKLQAAAPAFANLESNANLLYEVATAVQHLPTTAGRLELTAGKLAGLERNAAVLGEAADKLAHLHHTADQLLAVVDQLGSLENVASRLLHAVTEARQAMNVVNRPPSSERET